MIGRWLFVRIRAAEAALQDGRIDEAYAAAIQPDMRAQRRGQELLDALVRPLLARARLHLQAGRYADALGDLDRLHAAGRNSPESEELRQRAATQLREQEGRAGARAAAYQQARENLDAGRLETGRLAIERVDDSRRREALREQLELRVERSAQLLAQAAEQLARGDVLAAIRTWQETLQRHGRTQAADELAGRLAAALRGNLGQWLADGKLDRLVGARPALEGLGRFDPDLGEFERISGLCRRAAEQLDGREYRGLRETLLRLRSAAGPAPWLEAALGAAGRIGEASDALLAGPLGICASPGGAAGPERVPAEALLATRAAVPAVGGEARGDGAPVHLGRSGLLMLVDGAGSGLLVPQDCVRIGRAGSSQPADVPIPAEIQSHHADIVRDGDDYFLTAFGPVRVNHREVKRTLLRDGDRILLGDACRLQFQQPSTRSATAVLKLPHRCRLPQDVSAVILFRETCLIGPQASCHVRTGDGRTQVVLFERGGVLYGREAAAAGGKLGDAKPLALGRPAEFGELRVTVKEYR